MDFQKLDKTAPAGTVMPSRMASCPACKELNAELSTHCLFCDAPLPWAEGQDQAERPPISRPDESPATNFRSLTAYQLSDGFELWRFLTSFFCPPIGVVLWLINSGHSPLRARCALIGLLTGTVAQPLFYIVLTRKYLALLNGEL